MPPLEQLLAAASQRLQSLGIEFPRGYRVVYHSQSFCDTANDLIGVMSSGTNQLRELVHELGHAVYEVLPPVVHAEWFREVNKLFGGALAPAHDHEVFARTVEHSAMDDEHEPHYAERKRLLLGIISGGSGSGD